MLPSIPTKEIMRTVQQSQEDMSRIVALLEELVEIERNRDG
jgi:hypothetical protein